MERLVIRVQIIHTIVIHTTRRITKKKTRIFLKREIDENGKWHYMSNFGHGWHVITQNEYQDLEAINNEKEKDLIEKLLSTH